MVSVDLRKAGFLTAALFLAVACRPKPSATLVPDAALMPLVPADTTVLAGIRVTELKKTPVYQKLVEEQKLPQIDEFMRETGIDPRKDIWEIVFAYNGEQTIALIRGKFTEGGIADSGKEPELAKKGIRRFAYRGYTLAGDDRVAVTFFNSSVGVAGPVAAVKRVIDARDGAEGRPPAELIDRIRLIPSTNQIWAVSRAGWQGTIPKALEEQIGTFKAMPFEIQGIAGMLDLSNGVRAAAELRSADAGGARQIETLLRGLVGFGRLSTPPGEEDLLKLYDAIEVKTSGDMVRVDASIPLPLFEQLLDNYRVPRLARN